MPRARVGAVVCFLGSTFLVVLCGCGGGGSSSSFPTASVQLSVQSLGAGGGTVSSSPAGINCGQTCTASFSSGSQVTLAAAPAANSFFGGWSGACTGTGACKVTLMQNTSVMANFSSSPVLALTLSGTGKGTVTSNPSGINCGQTCTASFDPNTPVTLTATADSNSSFAGWTGRNCSSSPICVVTFGASEQVTATFNVIQNAAVLTVIPAGTGTGTVSSSPAGINCGSTCSASFSAGTQVKLTATSAANSSFAGWTGGGCSSSPTCMVTLSASQKVTATFNLIESAPMLTVALAGTGTGTVTSTPAGINCGQTCSARFPAGTQVTLTETPTAGSAFAGWAGGGCSGNSASCILTLEANQQVTATFNLANLSVINHIIFMAQENRSFDHYFGKLRAYWAANNIPDQSLDGLPQFNPTSGIQPLWGPPPTNPGCDPAFPPPASCKVDNSSPQITSFQLITQCIENPGDGWSTSHYDWNLFDPVSATATMNGFVSNAANFARVRQNPLNDTDGIRGMSYEDYSDLNYYYFMATAFATSDRWFSPVMTRTPPNREYLVAATSQGHVHPPSSKYPPLPATTIFQELIQANISWKIYVNPQNSPCTGPPYDPKCLLTLSTIQDFAFGQTIPKDYPQNIAPMSEYFSDLQNNTLPQVALIEPASDAGLDEHPSDSDTAMTDVQYGANYVSSLINGLMASTSWQDSVFILTYDEFGGMYDHVPAQTTVSPDGIKPIDLTPDDVCYPPQTGPNCDFVYTGFRMPLIVVSPYTRQNYVSHTVADTTAILKLIETRFDLPPLTKRDAAQMDMTEFFDFDDPPWMTPPTPPAQVTNSPCYQNKLP